MSKVPPTPSTWQEDLEADLDYYVRFFRYRFRYLNAELREEQTQEALCQVAIIYAAQWEGHGKRVENRFSIARCVLSRVKRGRSCTRGFKNADTLDRTYRKSGPKREDSRLIVYSALCDAPARAEIPIDTRLDLSFWLAQLPTAQWEVVEEYLSHATAAEVAQRHGVSITTALRWRRDLSASFDASRD